jgi:hypothetical protein
VKTSHGAISSQLYNIGFCEPHAILAAGKPNRRGLSSQFRNTRPDAETHDLPQNLADDHPHGTGHLIPWQDLPINSLISDLPSPLLCHRILIGLPDV